MTGLFDQLASPEKRQEAILRKVLEERRRQWTRPTYYLGAGDLLLRHGRFYTGRELPSAYQAMRGPTGRCFDNALAACRADPSLRYCEGVYGYGQGHYTPHAWAIDIRGELLELTVPTDPAMIATGRDGETLQPMVQLERWGYWGVVIHPDYVEAQNNADDQVGVLDRPTYDETLGTDPEGTDERREHFPIYTYPYIPDRRTP
jgi:hypothetical protein